MEHLVPGGRLNPSTTACNASTRNFSHPLAACTFLWYVVLLVDSCNSSRGLTVLAYLQPLLLSSAAAKAAVLPGGVTCMGAATRQTFPFLRMFIYYSNSGPFPRSLFHDGSHDTAIASSLYEALPSDVLCIMYYNNYVMIDLVITHCSRFLTDFR